MGPQFAEARLRDRASKPCSLATTLLLVVGLAAFSARAQLNEARPQLGERGWNKIGDVLRYRIAHEGEGVDERWKFSSTILDRDGDVLTVEEKMVDDYYDDDPGVESSMEVSYSARRWRVRPSPSEWGDFASWYWVRWRDARFVGQEVAFGDRSYVFSGFDQGMLRYDYDDGFGTTSTKYFNPETLTLDSAVNHDVSGIQSTVTFWAFSAHAPEPPEHGIDATLQSSPRTVFREDFDNVTPPSLPPGWTATGLWHTTDQRHVSPRNSLAYNREDTHDYDTGTRNYGQVNSPVIQLSDSASSIFQFDSWHEVESHPDGIYDNLAVFIFWRQDTGWTSELLYYRDCRAESEPHWKSKVCDLSRWLGQEVFFSFVFNTEDHLFNDFEGWYIDRVIVWENTARLFFTPPYQFWSGDKQVDSNGNASASAEFSGDSSTGKMEAWATTYCTEFPGGAAVANVQLQMQGPEAGSFSVEKTGTHVVTMRFRDANGWVSAGHALDWTWWGVGGAADADGKVLVRGQIGEDGGNLQDPEGREVLWSFGWLLNYDTWVNDDYTFSFPLVLHEGRAYYFTAWLELEHSCSTSGWSASESMSDIQIYLEWVKVEPVD